MSIYAIEHYLFLFLNSYSLLYSLKNKKKMISVFEKDLMEVPGCPVFVSILFAYNLQSGIVCIPGRLD